MKISKLLFLGVLGSFTFASCSSDDDNNTDIDNGDTDTADLYATNHSDGNVTKYNLVTGEATTFVTGSSDAEGIYYSPEDDSFTQASRSAALNTSLDTYLDVNTLSTDLSINIDAAFSSSADLESPRDLAVNGNTYVVSDNADVDGDDTTADGRFFIYTRTNGDFTLRNVVTVDFKVWGIEFVGNDLYAIVDTTNELAVFTNFTAINTTDAIISASKTIAVEGIVRTHGLDYDGGTMILTDIGAASSDNDGAFHIITDFDSKFDGVADGEMLAVSSQSRVEGAATFLGNPVNVVYDADSDTVFVAELANGGGRVLSFENASSASGEVNPAINNNLSGVSSLYFYAE